MSFADQAELDRELDRLYGLPLDQFTGARNELAKRAKQEGQRAIAARIAELAKPSLPAWVVNQLARRRELDVQRLAKAGEQLAAAQADALGGGGTDAFARARQEQQRALQQLSRAASETLAAAGRPIANNLDRVMATARAASSTEEGRTLLRRGRLNEDLELTGFEAFAGLAIPQQRPRRTTPAKATATPTPKKVGVPPAYEAVRPKPRRQDRREEQERARKLTEQARKRAAEARQRVRDLSAELRDRKTRLRKAESRAAELRRELAAAEQEAERLNAERRRIEDEIEAAKRELAEAGRE